MFASRLWCLILVKALLFHPLAVVNGQIYLEKNTAMGNRFLLDPVTSVGVLKSASQCGVRCSNVGWCMSIIYDFTDKTCYLYDRFSIPGPTLFWRPHATHYQVTSGVANSFNCDAFSGSCATVLSTGYTWNDGSAVCAEKGARLLLIDSAEKQLDAEQYMADQGLEWVWLGLTDQATEGQWLDEDGTTPVYTHFEADNPDNTDNNQHCAVIRTDWEYFWDDEDCSKDYNVICEMTRDV